MSQESWLDQLLPGTRCPLCDGAYRLVQLMAKPNHPLKAIIRCSVCGEIGIGTVQFAQRPKPINDADVLDMREFLADFSGDLKAALKK